MPTGQVIINQALTILGMLEQGGTPSVSDSNAGLLALNSWWDAAQVDEGLIFAVQTSSYILSPSVQSYPFGPTAPAPFGEPYPTRLFMAVMTVAVTGGTIRRELKVVSAAEYFAHGSLGASDVVSEEIYLDFNVSPITNLMTVYLWPAPICAGPTRLELETGVNFLTWTLAGSYSLPFAFQDAIQKILAWNLLPTFGAAVDAKTAEVVKEQAVAAEAVIRAMTAANRQVPRETVMSPLQKLQTPQRPALPPQGG